MKRLTALAMLIFNMPVQAMNTSEQKTQLKEVIMTSSLGQPVGTNKIMDAEGRTYHLGVKEGEVAQACLLVGDHGRAHRLLPLLDRVSSVGTTHRHFHTYTGFFEGQRVTIMSIGMGVAMMDFAVREIAQVTEGDLKFFRLGSAGTLFSDISVGDVAVARKSSLIQTDYQNFESHKLPYLFSPESHGDSELLDSFVQHVSSSDDTVNIHQGLDMTCEEFYATQGRQDECFTDKNESLLDEIEARYPETVSLQMETFKLYNLSDRSKNRRISAGAAAMIFAQRTSSKFLDDNDKKRLEVILGRAALKALASR